MEGDGGYKVESNSIRSQRELLEGYVGRNEELAVAGVYTDDGYTGSNFQRPGFLRMMEDISAGLVDCVLVKDLSRLGRDYIESGRLIQKVFPAYGVRFIAVTDHYDSLTADRHDTSLVVPVKNFVNDSYCRDISQKVRSHQQVKREKGEFIGAFTVYGYRKSPADKNQLLPDAYAAAIVRKIFVWKIAGLGVHRIAERLNSMGVLSPMAYKRMHGEKLRTSFDQMRTGKWSGVAVERILTNEVYTGTLVQGKTGRVNYKVKQSIPKPEQEWSRVKRTHEAIISEEDYQLVRKLLEQRTRSGNGKDSVTLLAGLLFCGDCGEPMIRREGAKGACYICGKKNRGVGCTRHKMEEEILVNIIVECLRPLLHINEVISTTLSKKIANVPNEPSRMESSLIHLNEKGDYQASRGMGVHTENEKADRPASRGMGMNIEYEESGLPESACEEEMKLLCREKEKFQLLRSGLYEDWKDGVITEEEYYSFRSIYEKEIASLQETIEKQENLLHKRNTSTDIPEQRDFPSEPNRLLFLSFLEQVKLWEIPECRRPAVDIKFNFRLFG
jgi:DNA invertase Pin-like site-specific DNA recombinase